MELLRRLAADPIAVYGAAVSTLLAAVRVLEWIQNRPRVVVKWGLSHVPFTEEMTPEPAISFWAYNFGSRATTLTSFLYGVPRKNMSAPAPTIGWGGGPPHKVVPPFPARLEPGGTVTAYWNLEGLKRVGVEPPYALVGFRDARGRVYYCVGGLRGGGCAGGRGTGSDDGRWRIAEAVAASGRVG